MSVFFIIKKEINVKLKEEKQLLPAENKTLRLSEAIENVTRLFNKKEEAEIPDKRIEYEK
ncbi:hypothetical protein ACQCT8_01050 [Jeotgalibacillus proteolyticus]